MCLQYLQFRNFGQNLLAVGDEYLFYDNFLDHYFFHDEVLQRYDALIEAYISQYPFLEYAASNWTEHVGRAATGPAGESPVLSALDICNVETPIWRTWYTIYVKNGNELRFNLRPRFPTTLAFCSWLGFAEGVQILLDQGPTISQKLTALALASCRQHKHVTRLFFSDCFRIREYITPENRQPRIESVLEAVNAAFPSEDDT